MSGFPLLMLTLIIEGTSRGHRVVLKLELNENFQKEK